MARFVAIALLLTGCLWAPASPAWARSQESLRYRYEDVWNAAVRLVRVEMRLEITEKDADTGFFLFRYIDHEKPYPGSVELVRQGEGARGSVAAVVQVGGMPRYVERMILTKLKAKLESEYGPPRPPPPRREEPPDEEEPESPDDAPEQG